MDLKLLLPLIPLLPLAGFLVNGLLYGRLPQRAVHVVACGASGGAFLLSLVSFMQFLRIPERSATFHFFDWIQVGGFRADFAFLLDPLSVVMLLVVTGVGFLIHIYSIGYMREEEGYGRYFAFLNLFLFSMLILILASNFLLLFVGWEGVGLCSYLLIGFYYQKKSAGDAGKKAFITNRIGDFGFLVGLMLLFSTFGTLDFPQLMEKVQHLPVESSMGVLTVATLLLFVGATGKSAQIPLYVWLPDAMEGPTPVSALIHAATMVTAGVYMVTRANPLFARAPETLFWVGLIGASTALFAATIGLFQRDIKRVLAYSTVSQLGYMFTALGVAAFSTGIFHVVTHAFFKALLFLGSGSVILALHHEQDMQNMGGLARKLPVTCANMWAGTLAIAGIPLFSGFFSKDEILWRAFSSPLRGGGLFYALATAGATLTGFYMFRLMFLTFHGRTRLDAKHMAHVHESPRSMTGVLTILAVLSVAGGFLGLPAWLGPNVLENFMEPVFRYLPVTGLGSPHEAGHPATQELLITFVSMAAAGLGILGAWTVYIRRQALPVDEARLGLLHKLVANKYYVDELYNTVLLTPIRYISETVLWKGVDIRLVDGLVNGWGRLTQNMAESAARIQSGFLRSYLGWVAVGTLCVGIYLLLLLR